MNKLTSNFITQLNSEQLKNLTTVVSETIAVDSTASIRKTFTNADLWKIHRAKKSVRNWRFI